ncbi:MAG: polysaccharide deacetylase family protein [Polyangiaceae bacterium]
MRDMNKLALSFDLEDWHQMVGAHLGVRDWDKPNRAFERQMRRLFDFLEASNANATFFMLGLTAKNYPELVQEAVRRGDEIACHGYAHECVFTQSENEFREDLKRAIDVLGEAAGVSPKGYRAPLFSINRDTPWALDVLADLGFEYDSSLNDTPKVPHRLQGIPKQPTQLRLESGRTLWELPPSTFDVRKFALPIGGGSYWRVLPSPFLISALRHNTARGLSTALYFHPYELDSEPLVAPLPPQPSSKQLLRGGWLTARYRVGQHKVLARLQDAAKAFGFMRYRDALEQVRSAAGARTRTLSRAGVIV